VRRRRARHILSKRQRNLLRARAIATAATLGRVALLLAAAELGSRLLWEPPPEPDLGVLHQGLAMQAHPTRMWAMRPGPMEAFGATAVIGEDGLRVVERTGAPLRILTLGDSSVFGYGVEDADTLHAQLKAALAARGVDADVLCGALPGYSTEQTLLLLDEVGWDLQPDLIVLANLWSDNTFETFVDREWLALLNAPAARLDRRLSASHAWQLLRHTVAPRELVDTDRGANFVAWIAEPYGSERRRVELSHYAENLDRVLLQAAERGAGAAMLQLFNRDRLAKQPGSWDAYLAAQV